SVVTALLLPVVLGKWSPMISLGLFMALWIITSSLKNLWDVAGRNGLSGLTRGLAAIPRGYYGMLFAHLGVAAFALGVCISGGYSQEKEQRMEPGQSVEMSGYTFRFDGVHDVTGPNYQAKEGVVSVSRNGKEMLVMRPQKRVYLVQRNPTTEADIDAGFLRHLYVALGEPVSGEAWSLRLYYKPFVQWIWMGPLMMFFGGLLAASDRRYRLATRSAAHYAAQPALARG
ncbi:MAG: cytochrome c-type biogenesis CcmF C-terminal domain-containing protein, partial [Gammaproteobacteria bacterium]